MDKSKMISVIIPAFNAEKFIGRAIESVLAQTYKDFEIIIINDWSTDNTVRVCSSFGDSRIKIIRIKHGGVGKARNVGVDAARGKWVFFLDSDDFLETSALSLLISKAENNSIVIGGMAKVSPAGKKTFWPIPREESVSGHVWNYLKTQNDYVVSHCWGRLYRRDFLERHNLRFPINVKVGEDGAFNIRCLSHALSVYFVNVPLYFFQMHKESSSVIAVNKGELDLGPLEESLVYFFTSCVKGFIEGLEETTVEWGKRNE
jgi:glycosyltransferase involved in cell wall biosynthesis